MHKPFVLLPPQVRAALQQLVRVRLEREALNDEYERVQQAVVDYMGALGITSAGLPGDRTAKLVSTYKLKVIDRPGALQWLLDHGKVLDVCNISTGNLNRESKAHPAEYLEFLERGWVDVTPSQQIRISKVAEAMGEPAAVDQAKVESGARLA